MSLHPTSLHFTSLHLFTLSPHLNSPACNYILNPLSKRVLYRFPVASYVSTVRPEGMPCPISWLRYPVSLHDSVCRFVIRHTTTWLVPESLTDLLHLNVWYNLTSFGRTSYTGSCRGFTNSFPSFTGSSFNSYTFTFISFFLQNILYPFFPSLSGSFFGSLSLWFDLPGCFGCHPPFLQRAYPISAVLHTGLFVSPSGISEIDCATTKTDTAERSISIRR